MDFDEYYRNPPSSVKIPFELGQTWGVSLSVNGTTYMQETVCPVTVLEDGNIGVSWNDCIYCYSDRATRGAHSYPDINHVATMKFVCISGKINRTAVTKLDPEYMPYFDLDVDLDDAANGSYSFTNLEQLQQVIDNRMSIKVIRNFTASGYDVSLIDTFPSVPDCLVFHDLSGDIVGSVYTAIGSATRLGIGFNSSDYANGILTPYRGWITISSSHTLVRVYAAPF